MMHPHCGTTADVFSFGVFADPHFARKKNDGERFFEESYQKLAEIVPLFQREAVDFVVCMGDFIDVNDDGSLPYEELRAIRDLVLRAGAPLYPVLGNHDILQLDRETLARMLPFPDAKCYYSFDWKGWHFAVLETNIGSDGVPYTGSTMVWDDCWIDEEQLKWLEKDLRAAEGPAVVLTHGNLDPRLSGGKLDPHIVKNHEAVRAVLRGSGRVKIVLQGHCHRGYEQTLDGVPYLTLPAIVEGPAEGCALFVSCGSDGSIDWKYRTINLKGKGVLL